MRIKDLAIAQLNARAYAYKQGWKHTPNFKPTIDDLIVMLDQMIAERKEMITRVKSL